MADSTRRQIAANLQSSFAALTTANAAKINTVLVEPWMLQPAEHPSEIGDLQWRIGWTLGLETPEREMSRTIKWTAVGECEAFTSRPIASFSDTELRDGTAAIWRQQAGADAVNELVHAIEGNDTNRTRGGYAVLSQVTGRYVDEGFRVDEATNDSRVIVAGGVVHFEIVYYEVTARS